MLRKFIGIVVIITCLWLLGSYYLYLQSTNIIFHTETSHASVPSNGYNLSFVGNKANENISMWYFENRTTDNVILYLHGNMGRLSQFFPQLTKKASVLSPAYPGYNESEGEPTVGNSYETGELAYKWLIDKGVSENKIIIFGHSLGGAVATRLAANHPKAQKLIVLNSFSSVQSMCYNQYSIFCVFGGGIFNSAEDAIKVTLPVREFALTTDKTVPFEEGKKLYEYFTATNDKQFIELDKDAHSYPDWEKLLAQMD